MRYRIAIGALAGLVLAGCAGLAAAQNQGAAQPAAAAPAPSPSLAPPPGQRGGGPNPQPVTLSRRPGASGGEALYVEYCAMCHIGGMGSGLLQRRGRSEPELQRRGDLVAAFVVLAARNGIGNMPAIPRGEVSDADMQAIAEYLAAGPHEVQP